MRFGDRQWMSTGFCAPSDLFPASLRTNTCSVPAGHVGKKITPCSLPVSMTIDQGYVLNLL